MNWRLSREIRLSGNPDATVEHKPLLEFTDLQNANYTLLVWAYLFGQFRIQLTDTRKPDADAPAGHGSIVQQMCTYKHINAVAAITGLRLADDPEQLAKSWARPWNSEGGQIRLDNEPKCEVCGCTEETPCLVLPGEPCAWANEEMTLCTRCVHTPRSAKATV